MLLNKHSLVIATRESLLALEQARLIQVQLQALYPTLKVDLLGITTQGDKRLDITLSEIGGKGLFVKELEEALLQQRADIAVHSMKDVPMDLPPDFLIPVVGPREEARDVLISNDYQTFAELPAGARVGTSSLRRQTQLQAMRPDLRFISLRGNIHTRLKRLDQGDYEAIVLAAAGLIRMNLQERIRCYLPLEDVLPAAGQGALGVECRADDETIRALIAPLNDPLTHDCVLAERALCRKLGGGCKVPIAAYARLHQEELILQGRIASADGTKILHVEVKGPRKEAPSLGIQAADSLLKQGAEAILSVFNGHIPT